MNGWLKKMMNKAAHEMDMQMLESLSEEEEANGLTTYILAALRKDNN